MQGVKIKVTFVAQALQPVEKKMIKVSQKFQVIAFALSIEDGTGDFNSLSSGLVGVVKFVTAFIKVHRKIKSKVSNG